MSKQEQRTLLTNRRARHEYFIEQTFEAGIALLGTEVKSLRMGNANLAEAYVLVKGRDLLLRGMHVSPYEKGHVASHEPARDRRLLMHAAQIRRLGAEIAQKGLSIIPLRVYLAGNLVKVEIALARGKKQYDKRQDDARRSAQRQIERAIRQRQT